MDSFNDEPLLPPEVKEEYEPVWEHEEPRMDACCLCRVTKQAGQEWVLEVRQSGPLGRNQTWGWCPSCAAEHKGKPISKEGFRNFIRHYKEEVLIGL